MLRFLLEPRLREFSFLERFVFRVTTLRLDGELSLGELLIWSISLLSPLRTLPERKAERRALFLAALSALALSELWYFSYSCAIPALVRLRFPLLSVYQNCPAIFQSLSLLCYSLRKLFLIFLILFFGFFFRDAIQHSLKDVYFVLGFHICFTLCF